MNIQIKVVSALALCLALSNPVFANKPSNDGKPPQRPSFASLDTNGDTDIDFDEFSAQELPFGDHQTIFDEIDTDNNGVLSQAEFANHKPPHPPKPDAEPRG